MFSRRMRSWHQKTRPHGESSFGGGKLWLESVGTNVRLIMNRMCSKGAYNSLPLGTRWGESKQGKSNFPWKRRRAASFTLHYEIFITSFQRFYPPCMIMNYSHNCTKARNPAHNFHSPNPINSAVTMISVILLAEMFYTNAMKWSFQNGKELYKIQGLI